MNKHGQGPETVMRLGAVARGGLAVVGGLAIVAAIALYLRDGPATAAPSAFQAFDAVYEVPVRGGLRVERMEYRGTNDWRLTTVSDDSNPEMAGSYKEAGGGREIIYNAKFRDQHESAIKSGSVRGPGPWFKPATAHVGVVEDRTVGSERTIRVGRSAPCLDESGNPREAATAVPSAVATVSDNGSGGPPDCPSGQRAVTWVEEYTYDAASGVPLRVRMIGAEGPSELRRATSFTLR